MSNANKPAFPRAGENGLTKREWFAGQALIGLVAKHEHLNSLKVMHQEIVATSLTIADKIIEELDK